MRWVFFGAAAHNHWIGYSINLLTRNTTPYRTNCNQTTKVGHFLEQCSEMKNMLEGFGCWLKYWRSYCTEYSCVLFVADMMYCASALTCRFLEIATFPSVGMCTLSFMSTLRKSLRKFSHVYRGSHVNVRHELYNRCVSTLLGFA